jgi:hypothetical protein
MLSSRLTATSQLFVLLACTACAAVQPSPASLSPTSADSAADRRAHGDGNVITSVEILPGMSSAYDVVRNRRPEWLHARGTLPSDAGRPALPLVYLEGISYGDCETLKSIAASSIAELRFLDARDATTRFGSGHTSGIILVTLRRG